jgi:transcriptional regulator with XRE-family HTH domain
MDFALAVYERRSALGLSSAELAERAGLTAGEIERIEESGVDPTLELIESLAEALHSGALIDPRATPEFRFGATDHRRDGGKPGEADSA